MPPRDKPRKKQTPTIYLLPKLTNCVYNIEAAFNKIKEILDSLCINHKLLEKRGNNIALDIVAQSNTWSNQRRKRRQQTKSLSETDAKRSKIETGTNEINDETGQNTSNESLITNAEENNIARIDNSNNNDNDNKQITNNSEKQPIVHALTKLIKKGEDILLELEFLDGVGGKEGLHQIVQYIKNNWK